jgi:uncharacterized protein YciI
MQFLIIGYDDTDDQALARRIRVRKAHLALGDQMRAEGRLLYAAAILDDDEKMIGSIMICDFPSKDDVHAWLKIEPYVMGDVWRKIEIKPCKVGPSFAII